MIWYMPGSLLLKLVIQFASNAFREVLRLQLYCAARTLHAAFSVGFRPAAGYEGHQLRANQTWEEEYPVDYPSALTLWLRSTVGHQGLYRKHPRYENYDSTTRRSVQVFRNGWEAASRGHLRAIGPPSSREALYDVVSREASAVSTSPKNVIDGAVRYAMIRDKVRQRFPINAKRLFSLSLRPVGVSSDGFWFTINPKKLSRKPMVTRDPTARNAWEKVVDACWFGSEALPQEHCRS